MWQYFWAHTAYHTARWFPPNKVTKVILFIVMILALSFLQEKIFGLLVVNFVLLISFLSLATLTPLLYAAALSNSYKIYCEQPLYGLNAFALVMNIVTIGFTIVLVVMEPVVLLVKICFHLFGAVCFVFQFVMLYFLTQAADCVDTTTALYYVNWTLTILSLCTTVYFMVLLPFWLYAAFGNKEHLLDKKTRSGLCYEPLNCCPCLWHV